MIFYATKQTVERYKISMPDKLSDPTKRMLASAIYDIEQGDRLLEWGLKLFYFDGRKCLQFCNFASRFTIVVADVKIDDLEYVGNVLVENMMNIYSDDKEMLTLLEQFFHDYPMACFAKMTDRSIIASMNHFQSDYLWNGYRLYDFIEDHILHTKKLNQQFNTEYPVPQTINGTKEWFFPAEKFAELLKKRYAK